MKLFVHKTKKAEKSARAQEVSVDIVCGMKINHAKARYEVQYDHAIYRFCSLNCQQDFESNPSLYV